MEKKYKLKWRVCAPATGAYRSFQKRGWPSAEYRNERTAATLSCDTEYSAQDVRDFTHAPISIRVLDWSGEKPVSRLFKFQATDLAMAKAFVDRVLNKNPHYVGDPSYKPLQEK